MAIRIQLSIKEEVTLEEILESAGHDLTKSDLEDFMRPSYQYIPGTYAIRTRRDENGTVLFNRRDVVAFAGGDNGYFTRLEKELESTGVK